MKAYLVILAAVAAWLAMAMPAQALDCSIDVHSLDVAGRGISGRLANLGSNATTVSYRFFIGDRLLDYGSTQLAAGATSPVSTVYNFTPGTYDVRLYADADCSASDRESITHYRLNASNASYGRCGIEITGIDYSKTLLDGQRGFATAYARNTGDNGTNVTLDFDYAGQGVVRHINLAPLEEGMAGFKFVANAGLGRIDIVARSSCGARFNAVAEVEALGRSIPIYPWKMTATAAGQATVVAVNPDSFDLAYGDGKAIAVSISTARAQHFSITVNGLPDGWADFDGRVYVSGNKDVLIYAVPKAQGRYSFTVTVRAEAEGLTFTKTVAMFVAPPQPPPAPGLGTLERLWRLVSGLWSQALIIIIAIIMLAVGALYLQENGVLGRNGWAARTLRSA
ncbi:MAG: hypothetical protein HY519_02945 [Candidatus Aenigmarchaeota archaeon]|nr:hypothetical protein [Candidatus Aenigmarchaeota archaeon]